MITRTVLNLEFIWKQIEELGTKISSQNQIEMMMLYVRLARRSYALVLAYSATFYGYY